ncbi:MAG: hypothetical protein J7L91_05045 [Candidatus Korarchaeota archaeon]|nr:hypothetical protein [Candidatus Korarchaeota archaeon]
MQGLQDVIVTLEHLWMLFRATAPKLLSAAVILLVGYVIGRLVDIMISGLLKKFLGLDKWVKKKGVMDELYGISPSGLLAGLVKWYIYLLFIGVAAENLGSGILADSARALVEYSPKILAGFFLMFVGLVAGAIMKRHVMASTIAGKEFFGSLLKFGSVAMFTIVALSTMGVDVSLLIQATIIVIAAVMISIGIAIGIAMGLVLKDELRPYIRSVLREILKGESERENGKMENGLYPP